MMDLSGVVSCIPPCLTPLPSFHPMIKMANGHNRTDNKCELKLNIFGGERMDKGSRSSNDDRSDSMNPNNPAYDDGSEDNRSNQMNPNHEEYKGDDEDDEEEED